jgi:hypothetical protein
MVRDREKLSPVLDSKPQKSISLPELFKNVFNNLKIQACGTARGQVW